MFAVPLPDTTYALGQAVALMSPTLVYCALTDRRVKTLPRTAPTLRPDDVVSRVALTREQLDFGAWPILGTAPPVCAKVDFANERYKRRGYVGAVMYDAALAEDFLAAFHGILPWDEFDPDPESPDEEFFGSWLVSPDRKPRKLKFKSKAEDTREEH